MYMRAEDSLFLMSSQNSYAPVWICWGILVKGENQTSMVLLDMDPQLTVLPRPAEGNGIRSEFMGLVLVYKQKGSQYPLVSRTFWVNSMHSQCYL